MTSERREPQDPTSPERPTTVKGPFDAFRRLFSSRPHLAPADATIPAFIVWLRDELGWAGQHYQEDLWCEYVQVCRVAGYRPIKWKKFGRGLEEAGFKPYQTEIRESGQRKRLMAVDLSDRKPAVAAIAINMAAIRDRKSTSAIGDRSLPSVPWPELPMRKAA